MAASNELRRTRAARLRDFTFQDPSLIICITCSILARATHRVPHRRQNPRFNRMEALAAIGLASNIGQFLDFGVKLVSECREIYRSAEGTTRDYQSLESQCAVLDELTANLLPPLSPSELRNLPVHSRPIPEEIKLAEVAIKCREASEILRRDLDKLRLDPRARGRAASVRKAIANGLGRSRIGKLESFSRTPAKTCSCASMPSQPHSSAKQSCILKQLSALQETGLNRIHDHSAEFQRLGEMVADLKASVDRLGKDSNDRDTSLLSRSGPSFRSTYKREVAPFHLVTNQLDRILVASKRDWIAEHALVETLYHETLSVRHDLIPEAHRTTFNWIFLPEEGREDGEGRPTSSIIQWLQAGEGTFWVAGKPGSGKSTLMKFMAGHPQVRTALQRWSGRNKCFTAAYYFWNSGTLLQKSMEGLLRSLLFDIFTQNPELIPVCVPDHWESIKAETRSPQYRVVGSKEGIKPSRWTIPEMRKALTTLSLIETPNRFCLFIDGMDEFHGDHLELLKIIKTLSEGRNFKLCVSSRPWNVFEDSLGLDPLAKLYVHDLTKHDIQRYIRSKMDENMHWRVESKRDSRYRELADEITERAQGVFLWVVLVVRSLHEGLTNGDSIQLLQRRMRELPDDLESFFQQILESIPRIYHIQTALYFRVVLEAPSPPPLVIYSFLDDSLERTLSSEPNPPPNQTSPQSLQENKGIASIPGRIKLACRRLNARTKGLLDAGPQKTVQFFHRTVRDFLLDADTSSFLNSGLQGLAVDRVVLSAYVDYFAMISHDQFDPRPIGADTFLFSEAMFYAGRVEKESPARAVALVTRLASLDTIGESSGLMSRLFMEEIVRNGLGEFIKRHPSIRAKSAASRIHRQGILRVVLLLSEVKFDDQPSGRVDVMRALLDMGTTVDEALWTKYLKKLLEDSGLGYQEQELEILRLAAAHADNVNARNARETMAWEELFRSLIKNLTSSQDSTGYSIQHYRVIQTLLEQGADPNAPCRFSVTMWSWFNSQVRGYCYSNGKPYPENLEPIANITELLIKAGADLRQEGSLTVNDVYQIFPPLLASRIVQAMQEQGRHTVIKSWVGRIGSWIWRS